MKKLNIVELYAGTGRTSEPFRHWERASLSLLIDNNAHARRTYLHNFPNANFETADLTSMTAESLESLAKGPIDILLGCPPCQGFSESGKRQQDDPRNNHMLQFARLAAGVKPMAIGMENVPLAAASSHFQEAMRILTDAGYEWTAGVLNAALYGSAQSRHRLVMVAFRRDLGVAPSLPAPTHIPKGEYFDYVSQSLKHYKELDDDLIGTTSSAKRVGHILKTAFYSEGKEDVTPTFDEAVSDLPAVETTEAIDLGHVSWAHGPKILAAMKEVAEGGRRATTKEYFGAAYARLHRRGLARTITTCFPNAGSGRYWHPTANRAITLREAARLQGFPDEFRFIDGATEANAILVGNALDGQLANATYQAIRRALD